MTSKKWKPHWVKWHPDKFLEGVDGMTIEEIGMYSLLLNMIYDNAGPIPDDATWISRRLFRGDIRPKTIVRLIERLAFLQKIIRVDGVLSNARAEIELDKQAKIVEKLKLNFNNKTPSKSGPNQVLNGSRSGETETEINYANEKRRKINGSTSPIGGANAIPIGPEDSKTLKDSKKIRTQPRPSSTPPQARRIDPALKPTNANLVFSKSRGLTNKETNFEWEKFVRYYRGLSGKNATSPDWDAVWESWVLRATERLGRDSFVGETTSNGHHSLEDFTREDWTQIVSVWRLTNNWSPNHGPAPGRPGCKVPSDLVTTN